MFREFRWVLAGLRRDARFTLVAVVILSALVCVNALILGFADAVLLRPLPYTEPTNLFALRIWNPQKATSSALVPFEYVEALRNHPGAFGEVGLYGPATTVVYGGGEQVDTMSMFQVTPAFFRVLGVRPLMGRLFGDDDANTAGSRAVLTYSTWRQRFGGDRGILGRVVPLGSRDREVIGVLPQSFIFPTAYASSDIVAEFVTAVPPPPAGADTRRPSAIIRGGGAISPIVRVDSSASRAQVQAQLDAIAGQVGSPTNPNQVSKPILVDLRSLVFPEGRRLTQLLLSGSLLLLLVGSVNLTNMVLVRQRRMQNDMAVRAVLGATQLRLIRPVAYEALLIGIVASGLGVFAARVLFGAVQRRLPPFTVGSVPLGVDSRVVWLSLGLGLVVSMISAFLATSMSRTLDWPALRRAGPFQQTRRTRVGDPLIAIQVAITVILLVGAALAGRALLQAVSVPLGFSPTDVATIKVRPSADGPGSVRAAYASLIERLRQRSDVAAVGAASWLPMSRTAPVAMAPGRDGRNPVGIGYVLPGYFEAIGLSPIEGRLLSMEDFNQRPDAAVVSKAAANALFSGGRAIGGRFGDGRGHEWSVVGVVGDVKMDLELPDFGAAYVMPSENVGEMVVVARGVNRSVSLLGDLRREANNVMPRSPVKVAWWADSINALAGYRTPEFQSLVFGTFGVLSLALTALGVFGVVSSIVAAQQRHVGIRLALGAPKIDIIAFIVKRVMLSVLIGLAAGAVAGAWLYRVFGAYLYHSHGTLLGLWCLTIATVLLAALVTAAVPAYRAARVDPLPLIRAE